MLPSKKDREIILKPYKESSKKHHEEFAKNHDGDTNFESDLFKYWLNAKLLFEFTTNKKDSDRSTNNLS